jgi:prevent-host-death family protein
VKFVTVRELRARTAEVCASLGDDDVVLTSNGRPLAVLVPIEGDELEATLDGIRRGRAQAALSRIRRAAARTGTSTLSERDIEREIADSRRSRRR